MVKGLGKGTEGSVRPAIGLLSTLFSTDLSLERRKEILDTRYGIPITKEFESEVTKVCNLSDGIEEMGRRKGIAEGLEKGSLITLFQLVEDGDLALEKAAAKAKMTTVEFLDKKRELGR